MYRSVWQIFGANTNVGKTVLASHLAKQTPLRYIKPIQTGTEHDEDKIDSDHKYTLFSFRKPVSPHLAARLDKNIVSNDTICDHLSKLLHENNLPTIIETAGGPLSPAPSGSPQADLYRKFRLPVILVGDPNLGGISTTLAAIESLETRGYTIDKLCFLKSENLSYFRERNYPVCKLQNLTSHVVT